MLRVLTFSLIAALGCSQQRSNNKSEPVSHRKEKPVAGKTVRIVVHRKQFKFDGVDRISILGATLNEVKTPIPFGEQEVDEEQVPFEASKHALDTGEMPDFIHRFKKTDGRYADFLIKDNRIATVVESPSR